MRGRLTVPRRAALVVLVAVSAFGAGRASLPAAAGADQPGEPLELGLADVELVAPAVEAAGDRPAFSWMVVDGAASYSLAVLTDGVPIWAWRGVETEVILGGWPVQPVPVAPGPLLLGPSTWFVVAYDAAGDPIANSVIRPVSP